MIRVLLCRADDPDIEQVRVALAEMLDSSDMVGRTPWEMFPANYVTYRKMGLALETLGPERFAVDLVDADIVQAAQTFGTKHRPEEGWQKLKSPPWVDPATFRLGPNGKHAIAKSRLSLPETDWWDCYALEWLELNGATHQCQITCYGRNVLATAEKWLAGADDVELYT